MTVCSQWSVKIFKKKYMGARHFDELIEDILINSLGDHFQIVFNVILLLILLFYNIRFKGMELDADKFSVFQLNILCTVDNQEVLQKLLRLSKMNTQMT